MREAVDPVYRHEDERNIGKNVRANDREPGEAGRLHRRAAAENSAQMFEDSSRQTGIAEAINDNEKRGKKNEQMPIDQLEDFVRVAARDHHDQRRAT